MALVRRLAWDEPLLWELEPFLERPMQGVVASAAEHTPAAIAEVMRTVYRRDWQDFRRWCRANDADPNGLPVVNSVIVAACLALLAPKQSRSALRRRTAAIAWHHHQCGVSFSASHPVIRETLHGIRRRHAELVRPVAPLTSRDARQLIATCHEDFSDLRDRTLFLVGFASAFRRSELIAIDYHDLHLAADCLVVHLARRKGRAGEGTEMTLPRTRGEENCPVRSLEARLQRARIRRGAVSRSVRVHGTLEERLTAVGVRHILLRRTALTKLSVHPGGRLSLRGLRAGRTAESVLSGAPNEPAAAHPRDSDASTLRGDFQCARPRFEPR